MSKYKMEVKSDFENKLLGRREVQAVFATEGAGKSRAEIKTELAKKYKAEEELIVVESIKPHFGNSDVVVSAKIYADKETLEKLTAKHIQKRNAAPVVEGEE